MPLTITEQIKIIQGIIGPPDPDVGTMLKLVTQTSRDTAKTFRDGVKDFDENTYPDASEYKRKMLALCTQAFQGSQSINNALVSTLVTIGASAGDYATIAGYTQNSQWQAFIDSNIFEAFELVSGTTPEEKTEYTSVP